MARNYLDLKAPIAALATPAGRSALAVIRVSGEESIDLAARCFSDSERLAKAPGYSLLHGFAVHPLTGARIDEVVVSVFRAPKSFTGENSVEISCHGSAAVVRGLLDALEAAGFVPALPGEFSFRAFAHGKTDLVRAEAINELSSAQCEAARSDALKRLSGALSSEFHSLREGMLDLEAEIESRLDYAEEEGPEAPVRWADRISSYAGRLRSLSAGFSGGRLRQEGALVVVAGRPNAGKSSLFNLLTREERAIVSAEPGTTRDWLEAWIGLGSYAIRLVDTAGLRRPKADVEAEGVRRSLELLGRADVVVYMVDGAAGLAPEDEKFVSRYPGALKIWNKIDSHSCLPVPPGWIGISARKNMRLNVLESALMEFLDRAAALGSGAPGSGMPEAAGSGAPGAERKIPGAGQKTSEAAVRIASERQKKLVDKCAAALDSAIADIGRGAPLDIIALAVREAADFLGEITGEIGGEEVFERIFGTFCLGK